MEERVGIIGAGKVGIAIGRYLAAAGCRLAGYASRRLSSAQAACAEIGGQAIAIEQLPDLCSVIILTTPDDALADTAAKLHNAGIRPGAVFLHMSGATPSTVLEPLYTEGGGIFSLHPIYPFADQDVLPDELSAVRFTAEGKGDSSFIRRYFPQTVWIQPEQKPAYHAALCMMSNYLVTLMGEAFRVMEPLGIHNTDCAALIQKTLDNILKNNAAHALTGPIARGDAGTVAAHLQALAPNDTFYRSMAHFTAEFARRTGQCGGADYTRIMEVLKDGKNNNA